MSGKSQPWFAAATVSSSAAFTLCGYEFVRSASNTLFKAQYGTANLPVVMALVPLSVILVLAAYNALLNQVGPRRTLWWTSVLSGAVILLCWYGTRLGWRPASALLYLFREAYVVLLIEQYWSFLNSTLEVREAKKYNGPITGWASVGAILGGSLVGILSVPLGTNNMLLFAGVLVLPGAVLSDWAYRRCGEPQPEGAASTKHARDLGLGLFRKSPLLVLLMGLILITQVYSTFVGLNFQGALQEAIPDPDLQTAYSGKFFAVLNGVAAFLQFVLAPILLLRVSVTTAHFLIPLIHVGCCIALLLAPGLQTAAVVYLTFKAFDYSVFRAVKEVLYIPLSFDVRYRAKELIDVFGYRFGKGATSMGIVLLQRVGLVFERLYAPLALVATVIWVGIVWGIRRNLRKEQSTLR